MNRELQIKSGRDQKIGKEESKKEQMEKLSRTQNQKNKQDKIYKRMQILMKNYFVVEKRASRKKIQHLKIEFNIQKKSKER